LKKIKHLSTKTSIDESQIRSTSVTSRNQQNSVYTQKKKKDFETISQFKTTANHHTNQNSNFKKEFNTLSNFYKTIDTESKSSKNSETTKKTDSVVKKRASDTVKPYVKPIAKKVSSKENAVLQKENYKTEDKSLIFTEIKTHSGPFDIQSMFDLPLDQIREELNKCFDTMKISIKNTGSKMKCCKNDVKFELEVCRLNDKDFLFLKFNRLEGSQNSFQDLCSKILQRMTIIK